ncbi:MAG: hypothetical protein GY796_36775, partial [Chloroflexi bacterium]|nr:hypothetical protein [Chloroflexota bacterium]
IVYTLIDTLLGYTQSPSSYTALGQTGSCLIVVFTGLLTGIVYVFFHRREEAVTPGTAVKGGAAAGGLSLFIGGIFGVIILIILLPVVLAESFEAMGLSPDLASDMQFSDLMAIGFPITMAVTACGFTLVGIVMGALGGVIGAAIFGSAKASQQS